MVTAVDTNVLLDVLGGSLAESLAAYNCLIRAEFAGKIILSPICYAEIAARFGSHKLLHKFLNELSLEYSEIDQSTAYLAGQFHREYRQRGGPRTRILADFFIAAHAQLHADRLLTRDARFFKDNFPNLKAVAPADL